MHKQAIALNAIQLIYDVYEWNNWCMHITQMHKQNSIIAACHIYDIYTQASNGFKCHTMDRSIHIQASKGYTCHTIDIRHSCTSQQSH